MRFHRFALVIFLCVFSVLVEAKEKNAFFDLPDDYVLSTIQKVRPMLYRLKISATEFVGQETLEELDDPLITLKEAERVLVRGIISSTAEWCHLEWKEKSFIPFMAENRRFGKTSKQMAYIGALHGFGMNIMNKKYSESECQKLHRDKIKSYLY
ncbi:MAG: hypothetical protein COA45_00950 [Zetaproteobacteria bacterium]|nr:MAG: hypothetical protein COA45_00950 [Zetaproteobacteria bacterium]